MKEGEKSSEIFRGGGMQEYFFFLFEFNNDMRRRGRGRTRNLSFFRCVCPGFKALREWDIHYPDIDFQINRSACRPQLKKDDGAFLMSKRYERN